MTKSGSAVRNAFEVLCRRAEQGKWKWKWKGRERETQLAKGAVHWPRHAMRVFCLPHDQVQQQQQQQLADSAVFFSLLFFCSSSCFSLCFYFYLGYGSCFVLSPLTLAVLSGNNNLALCMKYTRIYVFPSCLFSWLILCSNGNWHLCAISMRIATSDGRNKVADTEAEPVTLAERVR